MAIVLVWDGTHLPPPRRHFPARYAGGAGLTRLGISRCGPRLGHGYLLVLAIDPCGPAPPGAAPGPREISGRIQPPPAARRAPSRQRPAALGSPSASTGRGC